MSQCLSCIIRPYRVLRIAREDMWSDSVAESGTQSSLASCSCAFKHTAPLSPGPRFRGEAKLPRRYVTAPRHPPAFTLPSRSRRPTRQGQRACTPPLPPPPYLFLSLSIPLSHQPPISLPLSLSPSELLCCHERGNGGLPLGAQRLEGRRRRRSQSCVLLRGVASAAPERRCLKTFG